MDNEEAHTLVLWRSGDLESQLTRCFRNEQSSNDASPAPQPSLVLVASDQKEEYVVTGLLTVQNNSPQISCPSMRLCAVVRRARRRVSSRLASRRRLTSSQGTTAIHTLHVARLAQAFLVPSPFIDASCPWSAAQD